MALGICFCFSVFWYDYGELSAHRTDTVVVALHVDLRSRLLVLLDRSLDASPSISCRFWAWGVNVSRLYLAGLMLVEMGGGPMKVGDCT